MSSWDTESVNLGYQYQETICKNLVFGENHINLLGTLSSFDLHGGEMWNGVIFSLTIDSLLFMVPTGLDRCP